MCCVIDLPVFEKGKLLIIGRLSPEFPLLTDRTKLVNEYEKIIVTLRVLFLKHSYIHASLFSSCRLERFNIPVTTLLIQTVLHRRY